MSMFTTDPSKVKDVRARSKASERPTASSKMKGKATSNCAALEGCKNNTGKKMSGTAQDIVETKLLQSICFRRSRSAVISAQQSKSNTGGVNACKMAR